jgi:DNA polymerase-3 subunit delta
MAKAANSLNAEEIISRAKKKSIAPVYLLHGEEPFYIDMVGDYFEHEFLNEMEKAFNQTVVYGKDTDIYNLLNAVRRYPMMAERQLVMVKEAQDLKQIDQLLPYFENPLPSTVLVLCYKHKKMDGRSKLLKLAKEKFIVLESAPIPDYKLDEWVEQYCRDRKIAISRQAISMLSESLGNDLEKVANEIEKLLINVKEGEITPAHIEKYVGISREFNMFELQKAITSNNFLKAQKIIQYFGMNPRENSIIPVLSILFNFFSRLLMVHKSGDSSDRNIVAVTGVPPFLAREYSQALRLYPLDKCARVISYLHEYDLKSKGLGSMDVPQASLLRELVFAIMKL